MQITAEQLALGSIAVALLVPLVTIGVQSRQNGRSAFQSEALARIQMLRDQLDDCLAARRPISGGDGGLSPQVPMTPRKPKDES